MFSATLSISYHHICLTNNSRHFRLIPVHPATHPQRQPKSIHRHWRSVRPDLSNFNYQLRRQLQIPATPYLESVSNMNQQETDNLHIIHLNKVIEQLRSQIHLLETQLHNQWKTIMDTHREYTFVKKEELE